MIFSSPVFTQGSPGIIYLCKLRTCTLLVNVISSADPLAASKARVESWQADRQADRQTGRLAGR